jgi:hypothetical protein
MINLGGGPGRLLPQTGFSKAFPREVGTGSRKENAQNRA